MTHPSRSIDLAVIRTREACLSALLSESPLTDILTTIEAARAVGGITAGEAQQFAALARQLRPASEGA